MSKRKFIPLNNNVLIRPSDSEIVVSDNKNGLITDIIDEKTSIPEGIIVESSVDDVVSGDTVIYNPNGAFFFYLNGEKLQITNFENLFAKLENEY